MKTFQTDFYTRLDEINEYFAFITFIDGVETHKQEKLAVGNSTQYVPKRDLQKILRSNSFLLLYNLVESSIRNSILAVYDCIHDEALKYEELSDTIQEIWLINQSKKVQSSDKNVKKWLKSLIEGVSDGGQIILEKDTINISGNLDYPNIMKIINTYGFYGSIPIDEKEIKNALEKVKRERNLLAHGNKTFCQSGEIVTISDLSSMKDIIGNFIEIILNNIGNYIDNKKYRK